MEFPLVPPPAATTWTVAAIAVLLLALALALASLVWFPGGIGVRVTDATLRVAAPVYGRSVPIAALDLDGARILDLRRSSPFAPRIRTNGVGLPGLLLGWVRLVNGDRAYAALSARDRVLYLPTREGWALLLSPREPERLLERLREAGGARGATAPAP